MWKRIDGMRTLGLAGPGDFRDELNALVLAGRKTATAGLLDEYRQDGEQLEEVGERLVLIDNSDRGIATVEITRVETHPFGSVPWELARDEAEGFESIEDFRAGYRRFYAREGVSIADDDLMACVWFKMVARL